MKSIIGILIAAAAAAAAYKILTTEVPIDRS